MPFAAAKASVNYITEREGTIHLYDAAILAVRNPGCHTFPKAPVKEQSSVSPPCVCRSIECWRRGNSPLPVEPYRVLAAQHTWSGGTQPAVFSPRRLLLRWLFLPAPIPSERRFVRMDRIVATAVRLDPQPAVVQHNMELGMAAKFLEHSSRY